MELQSVHINRREIYRYLGYRGQIPDETVCRLIEEVLCELLRVIQPRNIYQCYECKIQNDEISLWNKEQEGVILLRSQKLADNLAQCDRVILMAATLGIEADKLLQRYEVMNMAKASVAQACGAACMEAYCNQIQPYQQLRYQDILQYNLQQRLL